MRSAPVDPAALWCRTARAAPSPQFSVRPMICAGMHKDAIRTSTESSRSSAKGRLIEPSTRPQRARRGALRNA